MLANFIVWLRSFALRNEDVEWIVNEMGELGVKIGSQFFFLYKARSYKGGDYWRYLAKREFGECCHAEKPFCTIESNPEYYKSTRIL